ncbi:MAG: DUF4349 domain-containing protein [Patescibacteria group bacterium]|nr:DUF4349 domain-containing protein [Patescibacteria group bacterium]
MGLISLPFILNLYRQSYGVYQPSPAAPQATIPQSIKSFSSLSVDVPRSINLPRLPIFGEKSLTSPYQEPSKIEVREGTLQITSKNIDQEAQTIKERTIQEGGFVETFYREEDDNNIKVRLSAFIPVDKFDGFLEYLLKNFRVKNSYVRSYKISLREDVNELDVLSQTLKNLEKIENEAMEMNVGSSKIDLLLRINNEKMSVVSKIKSLQGQVAEKTKYENYSTLSIELEQPRPFRFMGDEYRKMFVSRARALINDLMTSIMELLRISVFMVRALDIFLKALIVVWLLVVIYASMIKFWRKVKEYLRI